MNEALDFARRLPARARRYLARCLRQVWTPKSRSVSKKAELRGPGRIEIADDAHVCDWAVLVADWDLRPGTSKGASVDDYIKIGAGSTIYPYAMLLSYGGYIEIGKNCTVNPFSVLYGHGGLSIGNSVRIASHTVIIAANHNYSDPSRPIVTQGQTKKGVVIEDDVWIGAGARILDGVTVGHGAVVAAGAVVTQAVAAYSVVAGVPARQIGSRK